MSDNLNTCALFFSSNSTPKIKLKIKIYDLIDLFLGKR